MNDHQVGLHCRSRGATAARHRRTSLAFGVLALLLAAVSNATTTTENPRDTVCRVVRGTLVPVCNAAICNQGNITGDLSGRFTSKVTSIYPAGSGWMYTSWTRIDLGPGKGWIETTNDGVAPFDAKGGPDLSNGTEVLSISEATGLYQDYSGTVVLAGAHALGKPTPYVGHICQHIAAH
jgi:hypothetical protein